jgi:hypothetical protein
MEVEPLRTTRTISVISALNKMQRSDFKNVNKRPPRTRASFQGGQTNKFNRTGGGSRAKRFAGSYIDVNKFINKANAKTCPLWP